MEVDMKPVKLVYIAGAERSGSMLLGRLLGEVDDFVNVGEGLVSILGDRGDKLDIPCGCGESRQDCVFWNEVDRRVGKPTPLEARWHRLRNLPRLLLATSSQRARDRAMVEYTERAQRVVRAIASTAGAGVVIDSSKAPTLPLLLRDAADIDLRLIHLVRDAGGFIASQATNKAYLRRMPPLRATAVWASLNLATELLRKRLSSYTLVRYSDLANNPMSTLSRILE